MPRNISTDPIRIADEAFVQACDSLFGPLDRLVLDCTDEDALIESPELEHAGEVIATYFGDDNFDATPQMDLVLYVRNAPSAMVSWRSYVSDWRDAS